MNETTNYRNYDFFTADLYSLCHHIYFSRRKDETFNKEREKIKKWTRIIEYFFQNPEAIGTPFLVEEMVSCTENYGILDYDGCGELVNFDTFETKRIPSIEDTDKYKELNDDYFILWYNK